MGSSETELRKTVNIQEIVIVLTPPLGAGGPGACPEFTSGGWGGLYSSGDGTQADSG